MEFRNLTPFHALAFDGAGTTDETFHVVVMRVGYRLVPSGGAARAGEPTHRCELRERGDAVQLCIEDECFGAPHESSVRQESDLAPFKPRCDVLVRAAAHAPGGEPQARWQVRVTLSCASAAPSGERRTLLDKALAVCGPRWFVRGPGGWSATEPEPAQTVPVRWEHAFGGRCKVTPEGASRPALDEVCFMNPLGAGWLEARYLDALRDAGHPVPDRLPAPQIEYPGAPVQTLRVTRQPGGDIDARTMAELAQDYGHLPAGLGPVGRAWTPRLQRAGTYDEAWLAERWPKIPLDFDPLYWNAAPDDQQIDYPAPDTRIELYHLTPGGHLCADLPGHRALVLWRCRDGTLFPAQMVMDTLLIDAQALTLDVVWRAVILAEVGVRVAEARFEIDPAAPLLRIKRPDPNVSLPDAP